MPVDYTVLREGNLVIERWTGEMPMAEVFAHEREQLQDTRIKPGAVGLTDARKASFPEANEVNLKELANLHGEAENATSISRYALVMSSQEFDKARMLEVFSRDVGLNVIVFVNFEAACEWVGITPTEAHQIIDGIPI